MPLSSPKKYLKGHVRGSPLRVFYSLNSHTLPHRLSKNQIFLKSTVNKGNDYSQHNVLYFINLENKGFCPRW